MSYILTTLYTHSNGEAAANYAAALASGLGLPLRIVNPFTVPVYIGEIPMPMLPVDEVRTSAVQRLDAVTEALRAAYPGIDISTEATYGALPDVLEDQVGKTLPLLTVIGNNEGEDGEGWFGDETSEILREGRGPVLAVQPATSYRHPEHVCLACDAQGIQEGLAVGTLAKLQAILGLRITVLHVVDGDREEVLNYEASRLSEQLAGLSVSYTEVAANGAVDEAIAAFANSHNIDWLAIAPHHYGFWQGLFHKSHTTHLMHMAHVPILALHEA